MNLSVSNLGPHQYREAAEVLARAFYHDPLVTSILEGLEDEKRLGRLKLLFELRLKTLGSERIPLSIQNENKILGAALLYPPETYPPSPFSEFFILIQGVLRKGLYGVGGWLKWNHSIQRFHPKEPHFYLELIGVDPPFQRKGVGSLMLTHILRMAEQDIMSCYLETANPENLPFYHRFGFKIVREEKIIGVPTWFMMRPPYSRSSISLPLF